MAMTDKEFAKLEDITFELGVADARRLGRIAYREARRARASEKRLLEALRELVCVGDRKTVEWDRARAAIQQAEE